MSQNGGGGGGGTCVEGVYNVSKSRCVLVLPEQPFNKQIFIGHGTKLKTFGTGFSNLVFYSQSTIVVISGWTGFKNSIWMSSGKKGQYVWTEGNDAEAISRGIYNTYTKKNLRYSQVQFPFCWVGTGLMQAATVMYCWNWRKSFQCALAPCAQL